MPDHENNQVDTDRRAAISDENQIAHDNTTNNDAGEHQAEPLTGLHGVLVNLCQQMALQSQMMTDLSASQNRKLLEFSSRQGRILQVSSTLKDLTLAVRGNNGPALAHGNLTALASLPTLTPPRNFGTQIDRFLLPEASAVQIVVSSHSNAIDFTTPTHAGLPDITLISKSIPCSKLCPYYNYDHHSTPLQSSSTTSCPRPNLTQSEISASSPLSALVLSIHSTAIFDIVFLKNLDEELKHLGINCKRQEITKLKRKLLELSTTDEIQGNFSR